MLARLLTIGVTSAWLLCGCANTTQTLQADSDSVLRKSDNDSKAHGEIGVMYGQSAR